MGMAGTASKRWHVLQKRYYKPFVVQIPFKPDKITTKVDYFFCSQLDYSRPKGKLLVANQKHNNKTGVRMKLFTASKKALMPLTLALAVAGALSGCSEKSMEEHLTTARSFASEQNPDAAIIEYKNAIAKDPQAAEPRYELGRLYLLTNRFEAAEKELNRAMELGFSPSKIVPLLSQAYQQTGAENALVEMDHQVSGLNADEQAEVGFYKLQALVQLDKRDEAQALIDDLLALETGSVYQSLALTYRQLLNKEYPQALQQTEKLAAEAPENKDVLLQLGRLYALTEQPGQAIKTYQRYVELYPEDTVRQFALISLLIESRRMNDAQPYVTPLLKQYPDNGLLNQYQGFIDATNDEHESALAHLEKAIQAGQNSPALRLMAGFSAYHQQDFAAASQHLSMVTTNLPDNHPALRMLADSLLRQGESDEATQILSQLDGSAGQDAQLFSKAGFQLLQQGNMVDAKKMIEKTSQSSQSAQDLARLGALQLSVNDIEGIVNLEAALEKAPDSVAARKTLMAAYVSAGEQQKGRDLARRWIEQQPENADPYLYLAELALQNKNLDEARTLLNQATERTSESRKLTLAQIKLAMMDKQYEQAAAQLDKYLQKKPTDAQAISLWYALARQSEVVSTETVLTQAAETLTTHSDNTALRMMLAKMHFSEGDFEQTLAVIEPVAADKNAPAIFWNIKGQALVQTNAISQANAHYKAWVKRYPRDKTAVLGKLLLNEAQRKYAEGLATINAFLEKRPDTQIQVLKAHFLSMQKKVKPAREALQQVSDEALALPFVKGVTARLNLLEGNYQAALDDALPAYKHEANSKHARLVIAAYDNLQQREASLEFMASHYAQHPNDIRTAMIYAERVLATDKDKAITLYQQMLKVVPDNFVVLNNLAYLYLEEGQLADAEPLARRAVELQSGNPEAIDTLTQVLSRQEKTEEALTFYSKLDMQKVRSDLVYLNYVKLLIDNNQLQLAQRRLESREFSDAQSRQRADKLRQAL